MFDWWIRHTNMVFNTSNLSSELFNWPKIRPCFGKFTSNDVCQSSCGIFLLILTDTHWQICRSRGFTQLIKIGQANLMELSDVLNLKSGHEVGMKTPLTYRCWKRSFRSVIKLDLWPQDFRIYNSELLSDILQKIVQNEIYLWKHLLQSCLHCSRESATCIKLKKSWIIW